MLFPDNMGKDVLGRGVKIEFESTGRRFDTRLESRWAFHRRIGQLIKREV